MPDSSYPNSVSASGDQLGVPGRVAVPTSQNVRLPAGAQLPAGVSTAESLVWADSDSPPQRQWVRNALTWLVVLVAIVVTWLVWPVRWGGSSAVIVVSGNSMLPTLQPDDLVFVRAKDSYDVGDVIVYAIPEGNAAEGLLVIHRVVERVGDTYVTQGDNRLSIDPWRPTEDDIVGAARHHMGGAEKVRTVSKWMLTPWVWALFIGSVVGWVVWSSLRDDEEDEDGELEAGGSRGGSGPGSAVSR